MKPWKLAFKLSLVANIVLIFWALSQRTKIQQLLREEEEDVAALDQAITDIKQANDDLTVQEYKMIARGDQLDAFIEEHQNYGNS